MLACAYAMSKVCSVSGMECQIVFLPEHLCFNLGNKVGTDSILFLREAY